MKLDKVKQFSQQRVRKYDNTKVLRNRTLKLIECSNEDIDGP